MHPVPQQTSLNEQGATHFVEVERDANKNREPRQSGGCRVQRYAGIKSPFESDCERLAQEEATMMRYVDDD